MIYQIKRMFKNCPKPDGWYGCFAEDKYGYSTKLTGKTTLPIGEGLFISVEDKDTTDDGQGGLKISSYEILTDTNARMLNYLFLVPSISTFQARQLVSDFGTDTLKILATEPDKIKDCIGINDEDLSEFEAFTKNITALTAIKRLAPMLTEPQIRKIINHFDNPKETILKDPYQLLEIEIPWATTDKVALQVAKIAPNSKYRINHAIVYGMKIFIEETGNLCLNLTNQAETDAIASEINRLMMSSYSTADFIQAFYDIAKIEAVPLIIETFNGTDYLYETKYYNAEKTVAKTLKDNYSNYTKALDAEIRDYIDDFMVQENQNLSDEQKNAIVKSLTNKYSVITGGPGTGKTTITKCIYYVSKKLCHNPIRLLSPTGKASKRLAESTDKPAFTIARFLISSEGPLFETKVKCTSPSTKIPWSGLIIVDETSMIDILEAAMLLRSANIGSKEVQYIFIGDTHQLPPIEPGQFFQDIINSGVMPVSHLTTCYRNSGLIEADAKLINQGDTNLKYDLTSTMLYPQLNDDDNAFNYIIDTYNQMRMETDSFALLCPVKKGAIGTMNLNLKLHEEILPADNSSPSTKMHKFFKRDYIDKKGFEIPDTFYGDKNKWQRLRIGSKVIHTVNNPEIKRYLFKKRENYFIDDKRDDYVFGAYNGDIGTIIAYYPPNTQTQKPGIIAVQMEDDTVVHYDMSIDDHKSLQLAYAITIHKAQGSEYDNVIIAMPQKLLWTPVNFTTRNLLYTAFTRARNNVTMIGNKDAINRCITTPMPQRNSNLAERLQ